MSDMSARRDREKPTYLVCPDIPGQGDIPDIPDIPEAKRRHTPGYVGYVGYVGYAARYVPFVRNRRFLKVLFDRAGPWTAV